MKRVDCIHHKDITKRASKEDLEWIKNAQTIIIDRRDLRIGTKVLNLKEIMNSVSGGSGGDDNESKSGGGASQDYVLKIYENKNNLKQNKS